MKPNIVSILERALEMAKEAPPDDPAMVEWGQSCFHPMVDGRLYSVIVVPGKPYKVTL